MAKNKTQKSKELHLDALKFKEEMQSRVARETKGMTQDEELEYFHKAAMSGSFAGLLKSLRGELETTTKKKLKRAS